jgi:UDP:flavonoid glycosyltransferase YjiC (YdhE family)
MPNLVPPPPPARRIVLAPIGSRGDVQPMLALAVGLRERGHLVTLAGPANFEAWVRTHGVPFVPVVPDMEADVRRYGDRAQRLGHQMRILRTEVIPNQFAVLPGVCAGADLIVGAGLQAAGASVAEALGVPYAFVAYAPAVFRSAHHPPPLVPPQRLPRAVNRVAWSAFGRLLQAALAGPLAAGRRPLGLPPVRDVAAYLSSPTAVLAADRAITGPVPDLPPNVHPVPALRLADHGRLPPDVEAFLDAGSPPVLVGFGSMVTDRAHALVRLFTRAAALAGVRLLIQPGWSGVSSQDVAAPPGCLLAGDLPHGALLGRVAAVVHHGGAGTTTSVARGGRPQLVLPHLLDQFYWADRVRRLGLGPQPVPVWRVRRAGALARMLDQLVTTRSYAERAVALAATIRGDGVAEATAVLEGLLR